MYFTQEAKRSDFPFVISLIFLLEFTLFVRIFPVVYTIVFFVLIMLVIIIIATIISVIFPPLYAHKRQPLIKNIVSKKYEMYVMILYEYTIPNLLLIIDRSISPPSRGVQGSILNNSRVRFAFAKKDTYILPKKTFTHLPSTNSTKEQKGPADDINICFFGQISVLILSSAP